MRLPIKEKEKNIELINFINSVNKDLRDIFEINKKKS